MNLQVEHLAEVGLPGLDVTAWLGLAAPTRTPDAVVRGSTWRRVGLRAEIARWVPIVRAWGATVE